MRSVPESRVIPAAVFAVLRAYLADRASFSEADFEVVQAALFFKSLRPGEFLQRGGEVTRFAAFVARGCLRNYVIDPKGKEHIVQFAPETWWLADSTSWNKGTPSPYFIDAIEESDPAPGWDLASGSGRPGAWVRSGVPHRLAAACRRQGSAHRQRVERYRGGALSRVSARLSVHRAARAADHARVVSRDDARDRQPHPQGTVPALGRPS